MTRVEICNAVYERPTLVEGAPPSVKYNPQRIMCTYIKGHGRRHSFETLQLQDEVDAEQQAAQKSRGIGCDDETPSDVQTLLDNITAGKADPYLEAVLAVAHNRKRALRGTRGFNRL